MEVPFAKMTELGNLIFKAKEIKEKILQDKLDKSIKLINDDKESIKKEYEAVMNNDCSDKKKEAIKDKYDIIEHTYTSWNNSLNINTPNLDSYVVSSQNTVRDFKSFISKKLAEVEVLDKPVDSDPQDLPTPSKPVRRKNIRIINCVPVAKKKIKSKEDIDSVIEYIKKELEKELDGNDEIDLD